MGVILTIYLLTGMILQVLTIRFLERHRTWGHSRTNIRNPSKYQPFLWWYILVGKPMQKNKEPLILETQAPLLSRMKAMLARLWIESGTNATSALGFWRRDQGSPQRISIVDCRASGSSSMFIQLFCISYRFSNNSGCRCKHNPSFCLDNKIEQKSRENWSVCTRLYPNNRLSRTVISFCQQWIVSASDSLVKLLLVMYALL